MWDDLRSFRTVPGVESGKYFSGLIEPFRVGQVMSDDEYYEEQ